MVAELQRVQVEADGSTFSSATSAFGSKPTMSRGDLVAVGELHVDLLGLVDRAAAALGVGDHVGVGRDLAAVGDHEAGALRGLAAAAQDARSPPPEKIERIVTTPGAASLVDRLAGRTRRRARTRRGLRRRQSRPRPWSRSPASPGAAAAAAPSASASAAGERAEADACAVALKPRAPSARRGSRQSRVNSVSPRRDDEIQLAAHAQRELTGDRQPEPRAADPIARVEAIEDAARARGVDAGAVVLDDQARGPVLTLSVIEIEVPSGVCVSALSSRIRMI